MGRGTARAIGTAAVLVAILAAPGAASERADLMAEELAKDGVYVTDHAPRVVVPADEPRLRVAVRRLPGPAFLVVAPIPSGHYTERPPSPELVLALVHDRLRRDGLYLFLEPNTAFLSSAQFGSGEVPHREAARRTGQDLSYDASPVQVVERFADRVAQLTTGAEIPDVESRSIRERAEAVGENQMRALAVTTGVSAVVTLLARRRRRKSTGERSPRNSKGSGGGLVR